MAGVTAASPVLRRAAWIEQACTAILRQAGANPDAAVAMAKALTEAHLRGVETHGLRRLRPYLARMKSGGVDAAAHPQISEAEAIVHVDGRNAIGHYVASRAAQAAAATAAKRGIALALIRNSNHFGFAGHYATLIARHGQMGLVVSNGQVCVAPEGAKRALLSNDPLAIAAPTADPDAFMELDLATSVTSRANIVAAAKAGATLPEGLAQDRDGVPTTDAKAALDGSLLAFGGHKGFALLFALEALTGVLSGGAYADQVSSKEAAPDAPEGTAHVMIAISLERAIGEERFRGRLADMIARLAGLPVGEDAAPIRYPGQRRWELRRERLKLGVPLSAADAGELDALAKEAGVALREV